MAYNNVTACIYMHVHTDMQSNVSYRGPNKNIQKPYGIYSLLLPIHKVAMCKYSGKVSDAIRISFPISF
jgi:hypothetical protein